MKPEICKRDARGQSIYKSDTNQMDVLQLLCFMVHEQIKTCVWHEKHIYTASPVQQNCASGLADGKHWFSMLLVN